MNIRQMIDKHPVSASSIALGVVAVSFLWMIMFTKQAQSAADQSKAFFSDDDGATFFADAYDKPSGFDHNGKIAYAVNVFVKPSGQPFVGFLRRNGSITIVRPKPKAAAGPNSKIFGPNADKEFKKHVPVGTPSVTPPGTSAATPPSTPADAPVTAGSGPGGMVAPGTVQALVKRPGEKNWHAATDAEGRAILKEFGPDAQGQDLQVVNP